MGERGASETVETPREAVRRGAGAATETAPEVWSVGLATVGTRSAAPPPPEGTRIPGGRISTTVMTGSGAGSVRSVTGSRTSEIVAWPGSGISIVTSARAPA
jgi:hypothetical protein